MQRAAELRCGLPWLQIARLLAGPKAIRYTTENRTIVQRTKISTELSEILKKIRISMPEKIMKINGRSPETALA